MAMTMMVSSALAIFFCYNLKKKKYPQQFFYFYKSSCGRRKFEADTIV